MKCWSESEERKKTPTTVSWGLFVKTENLFSAFGLSTAWKYRTCVFDGSGFAMAIEVGCYLLPAITGLWGVTDGRGKAAAQGKTAAPVCQR